VVYLPGADLPTLKAFGRVAAEEEKGERVSGEDENGAEPTSLSLPTSLSRFASASSLVRVRIFSRYSGCMTADPRTTSALPDPA
jgi:hypothetical protein